MISHKRVTEIFNDCLYTKDEKAALGGNPPLEAKLVDGIILKVALHPERIKGYREEVKSFIDQLPRKFHEGGRDGICGGHSFLRMCSDKDDKKWAPSYRPMAELLMLAMGLEIGRFCLPRKNWKKMPGGTAYVIFNTSDEGLEVPVGYGALLSIKD